MITLPTNLTNEQRDALGVRGASVALSAGAGCGKTSVLTERFLNQLQRDMNGRPAAEKLHEVVAITFTDRAAREMRDRIRMKCYDRLENAPAEQAESWLRLLRSLDGARISTIHSFCGALLRAHAVEAQLDPRFVVIEQSQAETLLAEIIEDVLREKLSDPSDPLNGPIVDLAANFGLDRLQSMISTILAAGRAVDFDAWIDKGPAELVTIWNNFRQTVVVPAVLNNFVELPASRELLSAAGAMEPAGGKLGQRCTAILRFFDGLVDAGGPADRLNGIIENARVLGLRKTDRSDPNYEQFKTAAEKVRDAADKALAFFRWNPDAALADAKAGLQLLDVSREVLKAYEARKQELAWIDFDDLLAKAARLLADPAHKELQEQIASQIKLLLVDECQDTDPIQVALIESLCGPRDAGGKLFFVGDYKQSIYRFRGADPKVFLRMQSQTSSHGRLPLTRNFRSQPAILNFVNALFCEALDGDPQGASDVGRPDGKSHQVLRYEPLRASRGQITPTPAVEFLWAKIDSVNKNDSGAREFARQQEAELIARRIRSMLDQQEKLVAQNDADGQRTARKPEFKDIAILFRALSNVEHYEAALRAYDIDYYLVGGHAFYAQQEIHDVVNLLRSLDSPSNTISLAGALRSPLFALDDETLYWLAQHPQGLAAGLFAESLPHELNARQRSRASTAASQLRALREAKDRLSISGLLNKAMSLTGYDAAILAEFMGERKLANLRKLQDQARSFDQSGALCLSDFIVQLSQFIVEQPREALAATHPEGTNVVRLMTIHQAKGLEFSIVFVADFGRDARNNDRPVAWYPEMGPLVKMPLKGKTAKHISGFDLHQAIKLREDQEELIRLLYVATTRAADYLVLSGGLFESDFESPGLPWLRLLSERFDLANGQFRGKLPAGDAHEFPLVKVAENDCAGGLSTRSGAKRVDLDTVLTNITERLKSESSKENVVIDFVDRYVAPIEIDRAAQRRLSVSRLSGQLHLIPEQSATLGKAEEGMGLQHAAAGAELGTLVHRILARLDFARTGTSSDVSNLRKVIACALENTDDETHEFTEPAVAMLEGYLRSNRAKELRDARRLYRELEFLLAWPPNCDEMQRMAQGERLRNPTMSPEDTPQRYIQGFIDCLYQDAAGQWHLLDYKTNQVSPEKAAAAAAQYEMQMGVYALATEQILGGAPAEIVVHFLRPSIEHAFTWNAERRRSTIELVNSAIAACLQEKISDR
jgi:ATP-dependent helicase/nuclease subunit A